MYPGFPISSRPGTFKRVLEIPECLVSKQITKKLQFLKLLSKKKQQLTLVVRIPRFKIPFKSKLVVLSRE